MNVALINGSPKSTSSASASLLKELKNYLNKEFVQEYAFHTNHAAENASSIFSHTPEILVFAFPLYVDGVPGHLLRCMKSLEEYLQAHPNENGNIYTIVNCGFFEGEQTGHALDIMKNWCKRTPLHWGQGIGIGGGGMLESIQNVPAGKGPRKNISQILLSLSHHILKKETAPNQFTSPNIPRFLYRLAAQKNWRSEIQNNGLQTKDLFRQL